MIIAFVLFENEFLNIVAISFTALILNELIMVALEITKWYVSFLPTAGVLNNNLPFLQARLYGHLGGCHPRNIRI